MWLMGSSYSSCDSKPPCQDPSFLSSQAATVLLVDGRILHYAKPVKVLEVLIDHPDHVMFTAASFRVGTPAVSPLHVQETLQLGQLYFLLQWQTFQSSISSTSLPRKQVQVPAAKPAMSLPPTKQLAPASIAKPAMSTRSSRKPRSNSINNNGIRRPRMTARIVPFPRHLSASCNINRLCNTSDLQRAYISLMGTMCRDWKPALQTIAEADLLLL